jgi:hypothetical protein
MESESTAFIIEIIPCLATGQIDRPSKIQI